MDIFISDSVQEAIAQAAQTAQHVLEQQEGTHYSIGDLQAVLVKWLETSIESLAEDAIYHCLEGDRAYAFNRHGFTTALQALTPAHTPAEVNSLVA